MNTLEARQPLRAKLGAQASVAALVGASGVRVVRNSPLHLTARLAPVARATARVSTTSAPLVVEGDVSEWQEINW